MAKRGPKSRAGDWQRQMQTALLRHGFQNYREYMASEMWKATRKRFYDSLEDEPACSICGKASGQLDLHHTDYSMMGREPLSHLRLLCHTCHTGVHQLQRRKRISLVEATQTYNPQTKTKRERQLAQLEKFAARMGMCVVPAEGCPECAARALEEMDAEFAASAS